MTLCRPHPIWSTAGSSPAKISMATVQALMLSGRYRTQLLCSHWSHDNKVGFCLLSPECGTENIEHILEFCNALHETREKLKDYTFKYCKVVSPSTRKIVEEFCTPSSPDFCKFLLDCSVLPPVITAVQVEGYSVLSHLFDISRTWIYTLHKERMKRLGRWNFQ